MALAGVIASAGGGSSVDPDDPARLRLLYRERALRLAARQTSTPAAPKTRMLFFGLGAEQYAIELQALSEVVRSETLIPLPGAPREIAGIANVRGQIRTVIDMDRLLGLSPAKSRGTYIVLLKHDVYRVGIRIDSLAGVGELGLSLVTEPTAVPALKGLIKGVTADALTIVDAEGIFRHRLFLEAWT